MIRLGHASHEPILKTRAEVSRLRSGAERLTETLFAVASRLAPGVDTASLESAAGEHLTQLRADTLADLTGFPSVLCASRNNVAAHGVPDTVPLEEGDLVTLDLAARIDGWWGDVAWTFIIGDDDASSDRRAITRARRIRTAAWQACRAGVRCCTPGARIGDLAAAMAEAAHRHGCDIVPDFAGHGIGRELHEAPAVTPRGLPGMGARLVPGMVITVEPVVVAGDCQVDTLNDGWTYVTRDGSLAAQFEVMVYIHGEGHEVISYPRSRGPFSDGSPFPDPGPVPGARPS